MDGVAKVAGIGPVVTIGGRRLTVSGKILRHYAEIEAQIIQLRGNPFDLIRQLGEALPDRQDLALIAVQKAFVEARTWRIVTILEMNDWLASTWAGRCFRTWLAVRDNDLPTLTLEAVTQMYTDDYERIAMRQGGVAAEKWDSVIDSAIDQAEGVDELGNSTTSPSTGSAAETTEPSPGSQSSESSLTAETGDATKSSD